MLKDTNCQVQAVRQKIKSAFKPLTYEQIGLKLEEKQNLVNTQELILKPSRQLLSSNTQKPLSNEGQTWQRIQIEKLFKLYDYYGPQWKIMSQQMPLRTANNLKNRFYTILRNLIKLLFKKKSNICLKLPGQIPSKDLSRLYDGKQDYQQFKNFIPHLLEQLDYNLENQNIDEIVNKYSQQIIKIYQVIYGERANNVQLEQKLLHKKSDQTITSPIPLSTSLTAHSFEKLLSNELTFHNLAKSFENPYLPSGQEYFYFFYFKPTDLYLPDKVQ